MKKPSHYTDRSGKVVQLHHPDGTPVRAGELKAGVLYDVDSNGVVSLPNPWLELNRGDQ